MESPYFNVKLQRILIIGTVLGSLGLLSCSKEVEESSVPKDKSATSHGSSLKESEPPGNEEHTNRLTLSEVRVTEQGGMDRWKPNARKAVEAALFHKDRFAKTGENGHCKADFRIYYAITSNGEFVESADYGTALVGAEAMIHCQKGQAFESFRVELKEVKHFKDVIKSPLSSLFKTLVSEVTNKAADQLLGQILVRPLSDSGIIAVFEQQESVGKLMEAAIEAGERRLTEAIPQLVTLTKHSSDVVRLRAAAALGLLKANRDEVIRALAKLTEGTDHEQIVVAVGALADIGGPKALRYLSNIAISHPDEVVRARARSGVEAIKRKDR